MVSDRSITIQRLPQTELAPSPYDTRKKERVLEVSISFYNGWNGGEKGYFLHFTPVNIEKCNGYDMRGYGLYGYGGGGKVRLENAPRFNAKRRDTLASTVTETALYLNTLLKVLGDEKNDTEITSESVAMLPESCREAVEFVQASLRESRIAARAQKAAEQEETYAAMKKAQAEREAAKAV